MQNKIIKGGKAYEFTVFTPQIMREVESQEACGSPESLANYCRYNIIPNLLNYMQEHFYVICLNARRRIIAHSLISMGILDNVVVHPREVFRGAITIGAHSIVLMHNHPSGDVTPSEADIRVTRNLTRAGQTIQIEILDHIIMGSSSVQPKDYCSLRELGHFYS